MGPARPKLKINGGASVIVLGLAKPVLSHYPPPPQKVSKTYYHPHLTLPNKTWGRWQKPRLFWPQQPTFLPTTYNPGQYS